ncbi:MAG TPA: LysM domain-containing protein, partial [Verrucomicrobiae bacterium]|nr:LysM domain-containing protein [Verrucomicrobiae bacterium]
PPLPPAVAPAQYHNFSPGETVDRIAAQYGVTPNSIFNANPNLDFNRLPRGATIRIPQSQ